MNVMKTSLTITPMCPRERFSPYKSLSRLVRFFKKDWAILLHLIYFYHLLPVTNYLITKLSVTGISVLAENTLLKTACHFLLLLVGFDTLTYRKDYDRSPTLVGHQTFGLLLVVGLHVVTTIGVTCIRGSTSCCSSLHLWWRWWPTSIGDLT